MYRALLLCLLATTVVTAGVPVTFAAGTPTKADEVNKNFNYLDSAVGKKASQASLDVVAEALKNKAPMDTLREGLKGKASMDTLRSALKSKVDTTILAALNKTNQIAKGAMATDSLKVGGMILRLRQGGTNVGVIYGDQVSSFSGINYGLYVARDGNSAYINGTRRVGLDINNDDIILVDSAGIYASRPILGTSATFSGSVKSAAGAIKASAVADYVFEPGYKLAPLSEVEAFAKSNKHLPEVPSAAQIEKDGLDLANMNLLLLKKVEELTLHAIELEKRVKTLEAKN